MDFYRGLALCLGIQAMAMLVPGQNHFLLLSISSSGFRARALTVLGIASAGLVFSSGVVFTIWFGGQASGAIWFTLLNILGATYLIYLGVRLISSFWTSAIAPFPDMDGDETRTSRQYGSSNPKVAAYLSGLLVNISNPKSALFFASIFSVTIPISETGPIYLILAIVAFFLNSLLFHGIVSGFFALPRSQYFIRTLRRYINIVAGTVFASFGIISFAVTFWNISKNVIRG
jgi:threonine efflux protein